MSKYDKARRDRLRKAGLCIACSTPVSGFVRCKPCRKYHNDMVHALRVERIKNGLCRECGIPAVPGETRCLKHKIENAEACAHARLKKEVFTRGGVSQVQRGRASQR